jgi:2-(1,2-epoxy-1,2-dihydrophenyl)acetyl-CoA isomerase
MAAKENAMSGATTNATSNGTTNSSSVLLEETHNGVRILRLNRPEKKNALSNELTAALVHGIESAASDDAVRVVALMGEAGAFCSGADLSRRKPTDPPPEPAEQTADRVVQLVTGFRVNCEKPVIAGIDGIAIGAGLALAMCADIRMASSRARFHPGYARAGTSPDCGLSWTLPAAIGREQAMRFFLDPKMHDADAALALGLVGEVVPADGFDQTFIRYCEKVAEVAPLAATQTKRLVSRVGIPDGLEAHLRDELTYAARGLRSEDGREAVRAIREKRKPVFTGR